MTRRVEKKGGHLFIARLIVQNLTLLRDNGARSCRRSSGFPIAGMVSCSEDWYTWTSLWAIDDAEVDRSARAHHGLGNLRPKHSTNVDVVVVVHHDRGAVDTMRSAKSLGINELHRNRHRNVPRKGEMRDCGG